MNTLGREVLESASRRIGEPFQHHFKPDNRCDYGNVTVDGCMERGLTGPYDCSGLAIASLAEVLGISTADWPPALRHTKQLASIPSKETFDVGDFRLFHDEKGHVHIGIATDTEEVVHASGISGVVERSIVENPKGKFEKITAIAIDGMGRIVREYRNPILL